MPLTFSQLRNDFGSQITKFVPSNPSLVSVQKESYSRFLHGSKDASITGATIANVFSTVFPIEDSFGSSILDFVSYRLGEPKFTVEECREKSLTYASDLYITVSLTIFSVNEENGISEVRSIKEQEVMLCQIPLMTDNATFIINGCERVVVTQIHKSPGAFFTRDVDDNTPVYTATIMPYRGSRLTFSFDGKSSLYFRVDKKKKLPIFHLLTAFGMKISDMFEYYYKTLELEFDHKKDSWLLDLDPDKMVGKNIPFEILDSEGKVICERGAMINRSLAKNIKLAGQCYCTRQSIVGFVLKEPIHIHGESVYDIASVISESMINECIANGINKIKVLDSTVVSYSSMILNSVLAHKNISYEEIMLSLFKTIRPGEPFSIAAAEEKFTQTFCSPAYYDLFPVGRHKINVALGTNVPDTKTTLLSEDVFLTIKKLVELKESNEQTDDIDNLANRRLRSVGELLENQIRIGALRMARSAREKMHSGNIDQLLPSNIINGSAVSKSIKEFFVSSQLSQYMDQTNPLAELSHKRRLSALGPGGLSRERAGLEVRDVHPTHYGRICSVETPEGQNIGLINSLATYAAVNKYGFIESPYRKVVNCVVQDEIVYLDASQEAKCCVCQFDKSIIENNTIIAEMVSARRNGEFVMVEAKDVDYIDVSPRQTISAVTAMIPFLENDNVNRALTGSNMQRQAVPLIKTESPIIGTGMEAIVAVDSGSVVVAKRSGKVIFVDARTISVSVAKSDSSLGSDVDTYSLRKFKRSNNSTCINQVPIVKIGDEVKAGDVIGDGPATKNGEIALGKNLLVVFMPWRGYNFEDSIIISEKIVCEDVFTSIHIEEFEVVVRDTRLGVEEVTRDIPNISGDSISYLDESGIVHIGTFVQPGDILVGKLTPKSETPITPEEKLLRAIFGEKVSETRDSSMRVPPGVFGTVVRVSISTKRGLEKDPRAKQIEQEQIMEVKQSNEREIESVKEFFASEIVEMLIGSEVKQKNISKKKTGKDFEILTKEMADSMKSTEIIYLKCTNIEKQEKLNSIVEQYEKVISKMNASYKHRVERIIDGDDLAPGALKVIRVYVAIKSKLEPGDKMAGRHGNKGVVSKVVPVEDLPYMADGTPVDIVLNPLGVPSRMNIGQVLETHLGMVSNLIGKKINKQIAEYQSDENVKAFLSDILTDESLKKKINSMDKKDITVLADQCKDGFPFATPAFEAIKTDGIEEMFEKVGFNKSGQTRLYDGITGKEFDREVTVGYMYMMKLHHLVHDKVHARSTGSYSLVTQQPLSGKSHFGGQRLGEMECWALESHGAAYTLCEMLTSKSDDVQGRNSIYEAIVSGETDYTLGVPESFNVLFKELRSLCFNVQLHNDE